jgi:hypothetical protein
VNLKKGEGPEEEVPGLAGMGRGDEERLPAWKILSVEKLAQQQLQLKLIWDKS